MDALQKVMTIEQLSAAVTETTPLDRKLPLMPRCAARLHLSSLQAASLCEAWAGTDARLVRELTSAVDCELDGCTGEDGWHFIWDSLIR